MTFPKFGAGASRNGKKQIAAYVDEATWARIDALCERLHLSREDLTCLAVNLAADRAGEALPMRTLKQRFIRRKRSNSAKSRKAKTSAGTRRGRITIASFHPSMQVEAVQALASARDRSMVDFLADCLIGLDPAITDDHVQRLLYPDSTETSEEALDPPPGPSPASAEAVQGSLF